MGERGEERQALRSRSVSTLSPSCRTASSAWRPSGRFPAAWPAPAAAVPGGCGSGLSGLRLRRLGRRPVVIAGRRELVAQGQRDPVHEAELSSPLASSPALSAMASSSSIQPFAVGLGEVAEHMAVHHFLDAGVADADAHAAIILADMLVERADAVVAAGAAAGLDPHLAGRQVDLVIEDGQRRRGRACRSAALRRPPGRTGS